MTPRCQYESYTRMFTAGHYVAWNNTALPPNPLDWAFFPLNRDGDNYVADVCAEVDPP